MAKSKEQKQDALADLTDKFGRAKSVVFASFDTIKVKENEDLRAKLLDQEGEYYVAKKTLINLALAANKIEGINARDFEGKVATIFSYSDEVASAKVVSDFIKANEGRINFLGGILENRYISSDEVKNLAQLPSREELYAKVVGSLNAPVSGFVNVLAGNIRSLLNVLKAIEETK